MTFALPVLVALVAAGAVLGALSAHVAARRTAKMPTGADPVAEAELLAAVFENPGDFRKAVIITPDAFSWAPHAAIWAAFVDLAVDDDDPQHRREAAKHDLPAKTLDLDPSELRDELEARGLLSDLHPYVFNPPKPPKILAAGKRVLKAEVSRAVEAPAPVIDGGGARSPLVREVVTPTMRRSVLSAVAGAVGMAFVTYSANSGWQVAAGAVMLAAAIIVALVDVDTLYIDYVALAGMYAAVGIIGVDAVLDGRSSWLVTGLVVAAIYAAGLELVAYGWSKLRGRSGLGGGDTLVLIPSIAFPVAATGLIEAGVWGFVAMVVASLVGQGIAVVGGTSDRHTEFPWGPYLATGWLFGWVLIIAAYGTTP